MTVVGLLAEAKDERRAAMDPASARHLMDTFDVPVLVESSDQRAFTDDEYRRAGVEVVNGLPDADILLGVKEVAPEQLVRGRTYLCFAHVVREQPENRALMRAVIRQGASLIDYSRIVRPDGLSVLGFGRWAGIVGAYEGVRAYGRKVGRFELPSALELGRIEGLLAALSTIDLGTPVIAITGSGRVATGAALVVQAAGANEVAPESLRTPMPGAARFARLPPEHYARRRDGGPFDFHQFVRHPEEFESGFVPFTQSADLLITGHVWNPRGPRLFERHDVLDPGFRIRTIADVTCDIGGSVPTTLRAANIESPCYDVDPVRFQERPPFSSDGITMMAADNLPTALPRDATAEFGAALVEEVFPALLGDAEDDGRVAGATIAVNGRLTEPYAYLASYAGL